MSVLNSDLIVAEFPAVSKDILDNLFGSNARVKILKFLFRNHPDTFDLRTLTERTQEPSATVRRELLMLTEIKLTKRVRDQFTLNSEFEFFNELRALILKASPAEKHELSARLQRLGRVKLAVISGIFLSNRDAVAGESAPADLFIVADDVNRRRLNLFLKDLEAQVGTEIRFGLMEKEEFEYRYGMFDRFVRVLLEGPHEKIINKLGI